MARSASTRSAWQLGNLAQAVIDKAILMGIAAGAGTATASTGIGYSMAAYQAVEGPLRGAPAGRLVHGSGSVRMSDDAIDQELERVTGNPKAARAIRADLETLTRGGAGPEGFAR